MSHAAPSSRRWLAAAAVTFAAVLGAPAAALAADCVTTTNPLGAATGWTEFVAGNGSRGAESEGAIAYGGNLPTAMTVGTRLTAGPNDATLVIAGSHGQGFNLEKGSAYVNPPSGVSFNHGGHYLAANPIDFGAAFADLRAKSAAWGAAAATGTAQAWHAEFAGQTLLRLTGSDPVLNVFQVTPAQLAATNGIAIDVPSGSIALVNVSGASVTFTGQMWLRQGGAWKQASDGVMAALPGLLWNLPQATSVTIQGGSAWGGSILAPNAAVHVADAGHTIGQVIAASFTSNAETHLNLFPSTACLPGDGPTPPSEADVEIVKTASDATPHGGDVVTFTLTVRNLGPATSRDVVVRDALPVGLTFVSASSPCQLAGSIVTCALGDLAHNETRTLKIRAIADPLPPAGAVPHPGARHGLTVSKVEAQVDLEPGQTRTVTLACPGAGAILSDGSVRVDAVDQGTGALSDVRVLSARSTGAGTFEAVVRNGASGRAQAKAFAVCLPATTEEADGHRHALEVSGPVASTPQAWTAGRHTATLACPDGTRPIVPGYAFDGGAATLAGSEPEGATGWRFTVDVTEPTTATLSMRCLADEVATADGHTHRLDRRHVERTVTLAPGQPVEEQVTCADEAKGIVATWLLPPGVVPLGNDPRPKTRAFRLLNTTGAPQSALLDLECLADRTGPETSGGTPSREIDNTATVEASTPDPNPANNTSTARITVQGSGATVVGATGKATGAAVVLKAVSPTSARARIAVRAKGRVIARGTARLRAGRPQTVRVRLTDAGRRVVSAGRRVKARVTVAARGQKPNTKTVILRRGR
ncbi:MAG: choice-of-anchor A family protein [Solirubrobacteraceae bacterium]|nr:choice-of-anchor A family protein [Solirubrobacteraceae bacterium]